MLKDYYFILGVGRRASRDAVRAAFRELARLHHPDHSGPGGEATFRDIAEAYEVLSDPARRSAFDRQLDEAEGRRAGQTAGPAEPLLSGSVSVMGDPDTARPSFEELFERIARNFTHLGEPKWEHPEGLDFELIMSPEEARRGVVIPFEVPVFRICAGCEGRGRTWLGACDACDGSGRRADRSELRVEVPGGVRDGTVIERSLAGLGVENLYLRLHVRIDRR